jgi:hypothetical protein
VNHTSAVGGDCTRAAIYVKVAEDMAEYVEKMAALYGVKPGDVRAAIAMAVSAANFSDR